MGTRCGAGWALRGEPAIPLSESRRRIACANQRRRNRNRDDGASRSADAPARQSQIDGTRVDKARRRRHGVEIRGIETNQLILEKGDKYEKNGSIFPGVIVFDRLAS